MTVRKLVATVSLLVFTLILASCGGGATSTPTSVPPTEPVATEAVTAEVVVTLAATEAAVATEAPEVTEATPEATDGGADSGGAQSADGVMLTVTQENTALRSGPGTPYAVVTRVTVNATYPVVAQYGEGRNLWYLITLEDGTTAWAWSRVVMLNPADAIVPVAEDVPPTPAA